jgi:hypothetical protein
MSWVFRTPITVNRQVVTGDTDDTSVTYTLTHNGVAYQSGSLEWEGEGYSDVWVKKVTLPSTPGILVMRVVATVDTDVGDDSMSLKVEAA